VGVILNLALFFGYHVLWPTGFSGSFDGLSALITLVATIALFRFKCEVIHGIAAGAGVGFLLKILVA
jgi:chromate transporter